MNNSMFQSCYEIWDDKSQLYHQANSTELLTCCNATCAIPEQFCQKYCNDIYSHKSQDLSRCIETCTFNKNICTDTCLLSSPYQGDNHFYTCSVDNGCTGVNNLLDKECIKKHKESIFKCCRSSCVQSGTLNCQHDCEYLQTLFTSPDTDINHPISSNNKVVTYDENTLVYSLGGLVLGIVVIYVLLFLIKK